MWLFLLRAVAVVVLVATGYFHPPLPGQAALGAALGLLAAVVIVAFELKVRKAPPQNIVAALVGATLGLVLSRLAWALFQGFEVESRLFVQVLVEVLLVYLGIAVAGRHAEWFEPARLLAAFKDQAVAHQYKVLDTSVIIDGRIADICETGFLDGTLLVPQFVLRELQQVADSSDSLKRNRGRRGLDILQKIQKMGGVHVEIVETDYPEIREVDLKLIELGRRMSAKIVNNDFNLNKVAQLRGVAVLNINELANSLKPVVLPGEVLRVFVIKEGKEQGQGVAYLDDGTMVVVDQGKKALGRTIEVTVTSVLQTTAGKMIFCRWPEAGGTAPAADDARRAAPRDDRGRNGQRREGERREERPPSAAALPDLARAETPRPLEAEVPAPPLAELPKAD
jgi:uncharacterized protein YacL